MNQSELEVSACNWRQERKNACEQVMIGCAFTCDWLNNCKCIAQFFIYFL